MRMLAQIKDYARRANLPVIPVRANSVLILEQPNQFYGTLLDNVGGVRTRVALSALYIGTGCKESTMIQRICDNKRLNPKLVVRVVLDGNRAQRTDRLGQSSVLMLKRLLSFNDVKLNLVFTDRSSSMLRFVLRRVKKWNEILSTFHAKIMVFDDDTIITGANLSEAYFEKRQDRYIVIKNSRSLSDYMFNLLDTLHEESGSIESLVRSHNRSFINKFTDHHGIESGDTLMIPLIQYKSLSDKEDFMQFLCSILPASGRIHLSSGYFNPSPTLCKLRLSSVLAPSEKANGFYGADGLLRFIPHIYSAIQNRYMASNESCEVRLYDRPGWSFHAKGIWIDGLDNLYMHLMGSSNFNYRSSKRDFEIQTLLITSNKELIERLEKERSSLWSYSSKTAHNPGLAGAFFSTLARLLKKFL